MPQFLQLLECQLHSRQIQFPEAGKIPEIFQQKIIIKAFQRQSLNIRFRLGSAQIDGVNHFHLRMFFCVVRDLGIAGAAGKVCFL